MKARIQLESAKSTVRACAANEFAKAIILGTDNPAHNERPLTEVQRCDVTALILMCYYDFISNVEFGLDADLALDWVADEPDSRKN